MRLLMVFPGLPTSSPKAPLEVGTMAFKALLPEVGIGISF